MFTTNVGNIISLYMQFKIPNLYFSTLLVNSVKTLIKSLINVSFSRIQRTLFSVTLSFGATFFSVINSISFIVCALVLCLCVNVIYCCCYCCLCACVAVCVLLHIPSVVGAVEHVLSHCIHRHAFWGMPSPPPPPHTHTQEAPTRTFYPTLSTFLHIRIETLFLASKLKHFFWPQNWNTFFALKTGTLFWASKLEHFFALKTETLFFTLKIETFFFLKIERLFLLPSKLKDFFCCPQN